MKRKLSLREPMPMPNPHFPIKLHKTKCKQIGKTLFPYHWHQHLEFLYVVSGRAKFECNSNVLLAQSGDLIVVNSNDLHGGICLSDDLYYYAIIVDPAILHSHAVDDVETKYITPIVQNQITIKNKIKQDFIINDIITSIVHEMNQRDFGYELAIKYLLYQLLMLLLRHHTESVLTENDHQQRIKNLERFTPVFKYIEQHYNDDITVESLASLAGLSRFHFSRLFKSLTNKTVTEYINKIRLDKAEYFLRNTTMSISEIALSSGFNDIYYFSKIFKKKRGLSPSSLRKQM